MTVRQHILDEAATWVGTPYELNQCVKGAGVDCARFVHAVMNACGLMPPQFIETFGPDWSCHTGNETYKFRMLRHARRILEGMAMPGLKALPGSVVLVRTVSTRVYDHGGIVIDWPICIHAAPPKVAEFNASTHWLWAQHPVVVFDLVGTE